MEQRSEEWFEARKGRVTGSNVGAILGLDPNRTRADVLRMMVRDYHNAEREFTGNVATMWGEANEDGAKMDYTIETGRKIEPAFFVKFDDWLGASPDGYIGNDGLSEVKCPFGIRKHVDPTFKTATQQPHYYAQMQIEMLCANRNWVDFWQWTPHATCLERIEYDPQWIADNVPILREFYEEYLAAIELPDDFLDAKRVEIDSVKAKQMLAEYRELQDAIDKATERKKDLLAEIVVLAGAKNAVFSGAKLTHVEKDGAISYATAVKELLPGVNLDKYRGKPSSYWLLK